MSIMLSKLDITDGDTRRALDSLGVNIRKRPKDAFIPEAISGPQDPFNDDPSIVSGVNLSRDDRSSDLDQTEGGTSMSVHSGFSLDPYMDQEGLRNVETRKRLRATPLEMKLNSLADATMPRISIE